MAAGPLTAVGNPFVCKSDEVIRVLTVAHLVTTPATVILSEVEEPVLSAAAKEPARTTFVRRLTEQDQYLTLHVLRQHQRLLLARGAIVASPPNTKKPGLVPGFFSVFPHRCHPERSAAKSKGSCESLQSNDRLCLSICKRVTKAIKTSKNNRTTLNHKCEEPTTTPTSCPAGQRFST